MTIERAIEILDPDHREHYESLEPVNEACRMAIKALEWMQTAYVGGEWIKDEGSYYVDGYVGYYDLQCSICGEMVTDRHGLPRYCPWCGAKMEVPNDD